MDGYILQAFLLGLPANEIVLPIIIMSYLASNTMLELESLETLRNLFGYQRLDLVNGFKCYAIQFNAFSLWNNLVNHTQGNTKLEMDFPSLSDSHYCRYHGNISINPICKILRIGLISTSLLT